MARRAGYARARRRPSPGGRCQRAITNSGGGRNAATLYARRRILHSVFSDTMGRGVRVLKYEYEYERRGCTPRRIARPPTKMASGDQCPPAFLVFRYAAWFSARGLSPA